MKELFSQIKKVSKLEPNSVEEQIVKLTEEFGEFSVAHQRMKGRKKSKNGPDYDRKNLLEEGCDMMQILISILAREGFKYEDIYKELAYKTVKWEEKTRERIKKKS